MDKEALKARLWEFFRFYIVGILATAIHYGVYLLLMRLFPDKGGWWINVAYTIGYLVGFVFNFILSTLFTFRERMSVKKGIGFSMSNLVNYGLHILFLNLFLCMGVPNKLAPLPVFCLVVPINYLLVRFVFRKVK